VQKFFQSITNDDTKMKLLQFNPSDRAI